MNTQAKKEKKGIGLLGAVRRDILLYAMLALPLAYFILFKYVPIYGLAVAFQDYNLFKGVGGSEWVGFDVFREVFQLNDFYKVIGNTLYLNFLDLLFGFPIPIILAIILNEIRMPRFKRVAQSVMYFPHFISWIIIGNMVYQLLSQRSGIVNMLIKVAGGEPISFLSEKGWWVFIYVVVEIWHSMGWGTVIYMAAITGVNSELYEAAMIDGAGRLRRIWHITLPGIQHTIVLMMILNVGRLMSIGFERPFVIGNPAVMDVADVISTYVYRFGLQSGNFSIATAVGLFQSVINTVLVFGANSLAKRLGNDGLF